MKRWMFTAAALAATGLATAKLPPPDDAAKAAAAAAAAKAGWQAKVDAYQLCKAQDRVAAKYKSGHPGQAKQSAAEAASAAAAKAPKPTPTTASQGGATPVAAVTNPAPPIPPCTDPGPYAATPPAQKPLEASGAHSPPGTATSPPSVRAESGTMTSGKTGASAKK